MMTFQLLIAKDIDLILKFRDVYGDELERRIRMKYIPNEVELPKQVINETKGDKNETFIDLSQSTGKSS